MPRVLPLVSVLTSSATEHGTTAINATRTIRMLAVHFFSTGHPPFFFRLSIKGQLHGMNERTLSTSHAKSKSNLILYFNLFL
jgi:hypothetical protein